MESGDAANQVVDQQRETDDRDAVGDEDKLDVGIRADVAVDVAWEGNVLLPENDPVAGENQQKQHESGIGQNSQEIAQRFGNAGRGAVGDEDELDVGIRADVAVDVASEGNVLLPENDPVAGENQQKQHESGIGQNSQEIAQRFGNAGRGAVAGALGLAEEEENREEHGEDAEGGNAKYVLDAEMTMSPRRDVRAGSAANVDHGVVNGVADGAHVLL